MSELQKYLTVLADEEAEGAERIEFDLSNYIDGAPSIIISAPKKIPNVYLFSHINELSMQNEIDEDGNMSGDAVLKSTIRMCEKLLDPKLKRADIVRLFNKSSKFYTDINVWLHNNIYDAMPNVKEDELKNEQVPAECPDLELVAGSFAENQSGLSLESNPNSQETI